MGYEKYNLLIALHQNRLLINSGKQFVLGTSGIDGTGSINLVYARYII